MKISVVTKQNMQDHEKRITVLEYLNGINGLELVLCDNAADIASDSDRVLAFGGDGTMLECVGAIGDRDIPILGINLGNLGFLAECDVNCDNADVYNALISGVVSKKMLICTAVGDVECRKALNEVVIKSESTRPVYVDVFVDGAYVDTYHSDGVLISTPTGSTAYSLSCGGPVLAPNVDALTILPICAHSLHSRPLVVSANSLIRLRLKGSQDGSIRVDGDHVASVKNGEDIFVTRANTYANFITIGDDFYKKLFQKMNRWGTTQQS